MMQKAGEEWRRNSRYIGLSDNYSSLGTAVGSSVRTHGKQTYPILSKSNGPGQVRGGFVLGTQYIQGHGPLLSTGPIS